MLQWIPKMDELIRLPEIEPSIQRYSRDFVIMVLREVLDRIREEILTCDTPPDTQDRLKERIIDQFESGIGNMLSTPLLPVINATGVVVHTNLGRSPYPRPALDAIGHIAEGYSNLEFDLETGRRGHRDEGVESVLRRLFPGASAIVVNNNAAAVLLVLNSLADGKEVIVSRDSSWKSAALSGYRMSWIKAARSSARWAQPIKPT